MQVQMNNVGRKKLESKGNGRNQKDCNRNQESLVLLHLKTQHGSANQLQAGLQINKKIHKVIVMTKRTQNIG